MNATTKARLSCRPATRPGPDRRGFTLIELLVVVSIIAVLLAVLLPALGLARQRAQEAQCSSNIRQLMLANTNYAYDNRGHLVPAAEDIYVGFGGTKRWHGVRLADTVTPDPAANEFDPGKGPLALYGALDSGGQVKMCPTFLGYIKDGAANAFEASTGGYGYNGVYLGARYDRFPSSDPQYLVKAATTTARLDEINSPMETVMFTDAAIAQLDGGGRPYVIEYSFAEPPRVQWGQGPPQVWETTPTIHFRHQHRCNCAFADGHVAAVPYAFTQAGVYGVSVAQNQALGFGYPGQANNDLFDLK